MIHVQAEGTEFDYVPGDVSDAELDSYSLNAAVRHFARGPDTRLVVFASGFRLQERTQHWLVWQNGSQLTALDAKVRLGTAASADFEMAIRCWFTPTICMPGRRGCGKRYDTFVFDSADPYPHAHDLLELKFRRLRNLPCTACGRDLRQLVVKIIAEI